MVSSRSIIVLIGILGTLSHCALVPSLGTEIVIAKHKEGGEKLIDNAPPSRPGSSPFISNFIQKGTNLFFKPQFMLSSAHVPPPGQTVIVENDEDCIKPILPAPLPPPPVIMDESIVPGPVIIERPSTPVMIPEAPVLPPLDLPVPPVVIDCEEEVVKPLPIVPPAPVVIEEPRPQIVIPEAPVLPPLTLPALPIPVNDCDEMVVVPNPPEMPVIPMVPPPFIVPKPPVPVAIPEAPVLLPLPLPHLPMPVVIEEQVECDDGVVNGITQPLVIPTAPIVEMPLHPMFFQTLPQILHTITPQMTVVQENIERVDKIVMPRLPILDPIFSFPAECVQNIITERILPNILTKQKIEVVPARPTYPVPSHYLPTFIDMF